jgi:hypothetical protein
MRVEQGRVGWVEPFYAKTHRRLTAQANWLWHAALLRCKLTVRITAALEALELENESAQHGIADARGRRLGHYFRM